jgi:hypothetical protein
VSTIGWADFPRSQAEASLAMDSVETVIVVGRGHYILAASEPVGPRAPMALDGRAALTRHDGETIRASAVRVPCRSGAVRNDRAVAQLIGVSHTSRSSSPSGTVAAHAATLGSIHTNPADSVGWPSLLADGPLDVISHRCAICSSRNRCRVWSISCWR